MVFESRAQINFALIFKLLGFLLIIESAFMIAPVVTSLIYQDDGLKGMLLSLAITLAAGLIMGFGIHPSNKQMRKREAIMLTSLVWILFSLFGMLPLMFNNPHLDFFDAFFEAVSGFTTTGATVIRDVEVLPPSILLWRSMIQWIGGMGIILFTLAVLPILNHQGGIQLFNAEVSGITHDKIRPRIGQTAKSLWIVYIIITVLEIILLCIGPMNLFESICQSLSTVSTGGFSTRNASIGAWNSWYTDSVVIIFMFLGAVNFQLLYRAGNGDFKALFKNDTFRWYCYIILFAFLIIMSILLINGFYSSWQEYLIYPLFSIISGISSTGFGVTNFEIWGQFILLLFFLMMFFGGCAGSTTSGAKIDRLILLMKNTKNEFYKLLHPHSILNVRVNEKVVPYDSVQKVIAFLAIYMMTWIVCSASLALTGVGLVDSFFASISCISNIGYGFGYTGVNGSFANLADSAKLLLTFAMIMGRLELFTFLVIFTKDFWTK